MANMKAKYVQIRTPYVRIDLTEPCYYKCAKCNAGLARGDSIISGNGEVFCMECGKDKLSNVGKR